MGVRRWVVVGLSLAGCDPDPEDAADGETAAQCSDDYEAPAALGDFRTNTPQAVLDVVLTEDARGLTLVSSNFVQDDANPDAARWWFGEVRNDGDETLCFPKAGLVFETTDGEVMSAMDLFFDAPAYLGSLDGSMPCLAPGEHGIGGTLDTSPWVAPVDALGSIRVSFDATVRPEVVPHPLTPGLSAPRTTQGGRILEGTACNGDEALEFVWIYGYGRNEDGLVVRAWDGFYGGILEPGTTWEYAIDDYDDAPAPEDIAVFITFDRAGPGA